MIRLRISRLRPNRYTIVGPRGGQVGLSFAELVELRDAATKMIEDVTAEVLGNIGKCHVVWRAGIISAPDAPSDGARCKLEAGHEGPHQCG